LPKPANSPFLRRMKMLLRISIFLPYILKMIEGKVQVRGRIFPSVEPKAE
jgi:hypothetical protein